MELIIEHTTKYEYKNPVSGLIQTTKLHPSEYNGLKILEWNVHNDSAKKSKIYQDGEANNIQSFTNTNKVKKIQFTVLGKVETFDTKGIYQSSSDKIDPLVYLRESNLTKANTDIKNLAIEAKNGFNENENLETSHNLMNLVAEKIEYKPLTTNNQTTAIEAFNQKKGVCQDQAHIMIAAAKTLGIPARYVNGYMHNNSHSSEFQSTHAWAEFYINDLGWVGFDPTNKCSPDERYVRVSCGLDASYASPIKGVFYGNINNDSVIENLDIHVQTLENNSQQ